MRKCMKGKRIVALILALTMILQLSVTVFAANETETAVQTSGDVLPEYMRYEKCTRGRLATLVWHVMGEPEPELTENPYTDFTEDYDGYSCKAVLWCLETNVMTGYTQDRFGPDDVVTRGQVVTVLWRALGNKESVTTTEVPFTDVEEGEYFYEAVCWAYEKGVILDSETNEFYPDDAAILGDVVDIVVRAAEKGLCEPITELNLHEGAAHEPEMEFSGAKDPTCTESGYTGRNKCKVCGFYEYIGKNVPPLGHSGVWRMTKVPSCTETGQMERACIRCTTKETVVLEKNHAFDAWRAVDASGLKVRVCQMCETEEYASDEKAKEDVLNKICSKATIHTMFWRAMGISEEERSEEQADYVAAEKDKYYYAPLWWAENTSMIKDMWDYSYITESNISRWEVMEYFARLMYKNTTIKDVPFTDVDSTTSGRYAILWAYENGIISEEDGPLFRPNDDCTLGEALDFVNNAADVGLCDHISLITSIELDRSAVELEKMDTCQLNYTVSPKDTDRKWLVWKSSDPTVATVDQNGFVTAEKSGATMITLESYDGSEVAASCLVKVSGVDIAEGFDLQEDSYAFPNTAYGFGYAEYGEVSDYQIPLKRYQEVFGNSYTEDIYNQNAAIWNGNCFGMSATSALFHEGDLLRSEYESLEDMGEPVQTSVLDAVTGQNESYLQLQKNFVLTKLIERYQIWSGSNEWNTLYENTKERYGTLAEMFENVLERFEVKKETMLVVAEWKTEDGSRTGHTFVTDTARVPEDLGNGWTRIYLYDPNNPYSDAYTESVSYLPMYDEAENRYIDVNVSTGQWKLDVNVGSDEAASIGYDEAGTLLNESSICFLGLNEIPSSFNTKASFLPSDEDTVSIAYSSNDFKVYDSQQNLVYQKTDGAVTYADETLVTEAVSYGNNGESTASASAGKLILPKDQYKVEMDKGSVAYMSQKKYSGIAAEQAVTVTLDQEENLGIVSETDAEVNVVAAEIAGSDVFTVVSMNLEIDASGCEVGLNDDKVSLKTEKTQTVNMSITTEEKKVEVKDVSTEKLEDTELNTYKDIALNYTVAVLEKNTSGKLEVKAGQDVINKDVVWKSSDESVVTVSQDGTIQALKEGEAVITANYNHIQLTCKITVIQKSPFTDMDAGSYYYQPTLWAVQNSITTGLTSTTFGPDKTCTRGQVVTFLWRAFGSPESQVKEHSFGDVESGEYYEKAVLWALEKNITKGYTETRFAPDDTVTRAQVVTFLYRAMGKPGIRTENPFSDVPMDQYYCAPVLWACKKGIAYGTTETTFAPEVGCTRGQIVTFLYRTLKDGNI